MTALEDRVVPTAVVTIAALAHATEGSATPGKFQLTRTETTGTLSVMVMVSGTAMPGGEDYEYITGSVSFADGSATADVFVYPIDDSVVESTETVTLTIAPAPAPYTVGSPSSATVNIFDNDTPVVTVERIADAAEGGGNGLFRFTRNGGTSGSLTVTYAVGGDAIAGSDYAGLSGSVTFYSGFATADVTVMPIDDAVAEPDEYVDIVLQIGPDFIIGSPGSAYLTIRDNETPVVTVEKIDDAVEGSGIGWFEFTRTGDTSQSLTVTYTVGGTATPDEDYLALSGSVTFEAGEAAAYTGVGALSDGIYDPAETVTVTTQTGPGYTIDTPNSATITIADISIVTVEKIDDAAEDGANGLFLVSRTGGDVTQPLTVYYVVSGSADPSRDYDTLPGNITIPSGEWSVPIDLIPLEDEFVEGPETVTIALGLRLDSDDYAVSDDNTTNQATADIADNDVGLVLVESAQATEVEEDDWDTYGVFLSVPPSDAVTVTITPDAPLLLASESQPTPSSSLTMTFTPTDWDVPQLVTVSAPDNGIVDGDRLISITHAAAGTDPGYNGLVSTLGVQVKDKPQPDPKLTSAYWKEQATKRIDISSVPGGSELDQGILRNIRINAAYAELFQANRKSFYWMGAAAYASRQVGDAINDANRWNLIPAAVTNGKALADGNKAVYDDLYWQHLAFANGGIALMRQFKQQNQINQAQLDAWEKIADGLATSNDAKVWEGNVQLLKYEQETILQPYFDRLVGKGLLNYMLSSPILGGKGFNDYHFKKADGTFDRSKLLAQRLVTRFNDRWAWIENALVPDWQKYLAENAKQVTQFTKNLVLTDSSFFPKQP